MNCFSILLNADLLSLATHVQLKGLQQLNSAKSNIGQTDTSVLTGLGKFFTAFPQSSTPRGLAHLYVWSLPMPAHAHANTQGYWWVYTCLQTSCH